jgi:hypothetical protein
MGKNIRRQANVTPQQGMKIFRDSSVFEMFLSLRKSVLHDATQVSEIASVRVLVRVHHWLFHDEKALKMYEFVGCLIEFITSSALCSESLICLASFLASLVLHVCSSEAMNPSRFSEVERMS